MHASEVYILFVMNGVLAGCLIWLAVRRMLGEDQ